MAEPVRENECGRMEGLRVIIRYGNRQIDELIDPHGKVDNGYRIVMDGLNWPRNLNRVHIVNSVNSAAFIRHLDMDDKRTA